MAFPKLTRQDILNAIATVDQNGIPEEEHQTDYILLTDDGRSYPPNYVLKAAVKQVTDITLVEHDFFSRETAKYLRRLNFNIKGKKRVFSLSISAKGIYPKDKSYLLRDAAWSDHYRILDVYPKKCLWKPMSHILIETGRKINKYTLPYLVCKRFEQELKSLSEKERYAFPIYQLTDDSPIFRGIYPNKESCKLSTHIKGGFFIYTCDDGKQFVFPCWYTFSPLLFVKECLKRFGTPGEQFVLTYTDKDPNEPPEMIEIESETNSSSSSVQSDDKAKTKNMQSVVIAEPTYRNQYSALLLASKNLIFHGAPGTGKTFLARQIAADLISGGRTENWQNLTADEKRQMGFVQFHPGYDYSDFVEGLRPQPNENGNSMGFTLREGLFKRFIARARTNSENTSLKKECLKPFVFIIDEINRGDLPRIFGELFFAIDPGYRGPAGEVFTQYSNLHDNQEETFYIPENVYIIGTMNDIDRSVDTLDFAMRRRFRFIHLRPEDRLTILDTLPEPLRLEAHRRMTNLNHQILQTEGLNTDYQIGPAYFLQLGTLDFDRLWTDSLEPLLQEYVRGMEDEVGLLEVFAQAYNCTQSFKNNTTNETNQA